MLVALRTVFASSQSFAQFTSLGDTQLVANLLSDKHSGGNFSVVNRIVCAFLVECWEARSQYLAL